MSSISCNVMNCGNNNSGTCYANKISVSGKRSRTSTHTSCGSFLDSSSGLTNSIQNETPCSFIGCNVKTCVNNAGTVCALNSIAVTSSAQRTNSQAETYCSNFRCK